MSMECKLVFPEKFWSGEKEWKREWARVREKPEKNRCQISFTYTSQKFEMWMYNIYMSFYFELNPLHHWACLRASRAKKRARRWWWWRRREKKAKKKSASWEIRLKSLKLKHIFFSLVYCSSFALKPFGFQRIKRLFDKSIIKGNCTALELWNNINTTYFLFQSFAFNVQDHITPSLIKSNDKLSTNMKKIELYQPRGWDLSREVGIIVKTGEHTYAIDETTRTLCIYMLLLFNFHKNMQTSPNSQTGGWFNFRFRSRHTTFFFSMFVPFSLIRFYYLKSALFYSSIIYMYSSLFLHRNGTITNWNGIQMIMAVSTHYMYHPNTFGYRISYYTISEYRSVVSKACICVESFRWI